jgi:hypothetical protein
MQKELSLINGSFINESSNQRFGGSSSKASAFVRLLKDAKLWHVQVVFQDFGEQDSALTLSQNSLESVKLTINSGREDFRLKDFQGFLPGVEDSIAKISQAEDGNGQPANPLNAPRKYAGPEQSEKVTTKEIILILEHAQVMATTTTHLGHITIWLKNGKRYDGVFVPAEAGEAFSQMGASNVVAHFLRTRPADEVKEWASNAEQE